MRYYSLLPFSAIIAFSLLTLLVSIGWLPPGEAILEQLKSNLGDSQSWLLLLIILAESIIYLGFYFPGQFFAVVIVVLSEPDFNDMLWLTLMMVTAATLGSCVNYGLGRVWGDPDHAQQKGYSLRNLLLAMLHTNALAFYMFAQGANRHPFKVVLLSGLINLPYYLLLIAGTALLSDEVMYVAETPEVLAVFLTVWFLIALWMDIRKRAIPTTDI
ncbi:hypothetical protein [Oceanospirillum sp.]|uniref:hypothetical protein n=1 Tax=Oceanospirillum sp. TaxID=2021254 RepID=UPI003A95344D